MLLQPFPSTWVAPDELLTSTTHRPKGRGVSWLQHSYLFQQRMEIHSQQDWSRRELVHTALMLPSQETASSALPKHTLGQFACQYNTAGSVQQHPQSIAWLTWHRLSTRHKCRQDNLCTLSPITSPVFSFCLAFLITLTHCPEQIQLPS